jgi:hypothetical protein
MKRIALAMAFMACAAPGFAASEAPVSEYLNDPSYRSPLLTSPAAIADGFLDELLARMSAMFTLQTSIAPFKAGTSTQVASHASILSVSSEKDRVNSEVRKLKVDGVSPAGREIELAAKKHQVGIGSSLETPWEAWENREEAVTEEFRDIADR